MTHTADKLDLKECLAYAKPLFTYRPLIHEEMVSQGLWLWTSLLFQFFDRPWPPRPLRGIFVWQDPPLPQILLPLKIEALWLKTTSLPFLTPSVARASASMALSTAFGCVWVGLVHTLLSPSQGLVKHGGAEVRGRWPSVNQPWLLFLLAMWGVCYLLACFLNYQGIKRPVPHALCQSISLG